MTEQEKPDMEGAEYQPQQTPPPIPQEQPSQPRMEQPYEQQQSYYQGQPNYQAGGDTQQKAPQGTAYPPQNYMVMNIVAAVVGILACGNCCISMILGIVGIVFSSQVNSKFIMGDINGASSSANTAKILGIISLVLSALTIIGTIVYYIFIITAAGGLDVFMDAFQEGYNQGLRF